MKIILLINLICFWLVNAGVTETESASEREGKLKSACLYYLAKFVDYPSEEQPAKLIHMCIVGQDNLNFYISSTFEGKEIKGRKVKLAFIEARSPVPTEGCNLIYFGEMERSLISEIISRVKNKAVITVGGVEKITDKGGIVDVFKKNNKLKLRINKEAAEKANLKISSELLQISDVID